MSQPIITTDISAVRPVFSEGTAENIKRYTQLKKMFHHGKEYSVLAEPMLDGPQKITWHTEFEGTPQPFSKLSEEEQTKAKGALKLQVNKLYKAVFKQLYRNNMDDVSDMFAILDSCIEIPDYNNIYRILAPSGKSKYVLIKWGFISDDFNAPTELIKKIIPTAVDTAKIKVIKNQKAAVEETITTIFNGTEKNLTTDSKGYIYLEDIPLGANFTLHTLDKETATEYLCDGSDEYHFLIGTKSVDMNFIISDAKGIPLSDTEVSFTYDGRTYFETTNHNGQITLKDIPEGTQVIVKQKNNENAYTCDSKTLEYTFTGVRPVAEIDVAVMDEKNNFLPGIDVTFKYLDKEMTVSTDRNGRVSIDNFPPETEFTITCGAEGYQNAVITLFTHEGLNMAEVKVRKKSSYANMTIKVVDDKQQPIVNTLIRCENDGQKYELYTDENGEITLDKVNFNSDVICTQIINKLASHRHTFSFSQDTQEYIFKGGAILGKSNITDLEIQVINKQKQKVPNLRITIDDGHNVLNKITDQDGKIFIPELKRGKYKISTEYKNKLTVVDYECTKEKEILKLIVGKNNIAFLFWLIPLLILLCWLIVNFLIPKIKDMANTPIVVSDTTKEEIVQPPVDTTINTITEPVQEPEPEPVTGITMSIFDEKTQAAIPGAKIELEYKQGKDKTKIEGIADENGVFNFKDVPMDSTLKVSAKITAEGHPEFITTFLYSPEKKIMLPEVSLETNDIPAKCGETIKSKGFHSTIQTVKVDITSGTLQLGYDMFDIPDEIIVYNGKSSEISDDKIIYKSKGLVKGPFKKVSFKFSDPEGLITVRINGGDNKRTEWYFKVYCPSKSQSAKKTSNTNKTSNANKTKK